MAALWPFRAASPGSRGVFSLLWTGASTYRQPCHRWGGRSKSGGQLLVVVFGPRGRGRWTTSLAGRTTPASQLLVVFGRTSSRPRVAMPGRFKLGDKVTCVRNDNALGKRHAGTISKVRRTVRIIDGVSVPVHPAHSSMLHTGHQGRARPRLEPQQRLGRVHVVLGRHSDVRRVQARRPVVLLHKVRRRLGGAQGGPGADLPGQIMWPPRHWQARGPGADLPNEWCVGIPAAARS